MIVRIYGNANMQNRRAKKEIRKYILKKQMHKYINESITFKFGLKIEYYGSNGNLLDCNSI
jgi:hypothetical protein